MIHGSGRVKLVCLMLVVGCVLTSCDERKVVCYVWCLFRNWVLTPDVAVVVVPSVEVPAHRKRKALALWNQTVEPALTEALQTVKEMSDGGRALRWECGFGDADVEKGHYMIGEIHSAMETYYDDGSKRSLHNYLRNKSCNTILQLRISEGKGAYEVLIGLYNKDREDYPSKKDFIKFDEKDEKAVKRRIAKSARSLLETVVRNRKRNCLDECDL